MKAADIPTKPTAKQALTLLKGMDGDGFQDMKTLLDVGNLFVVAYPQYKHVYSTLMSHIWVHWILHVEDSINLAIRETLPDPVEILKELLKEAV